MPNVYPLDLPTKPRAGTYSEPGDDALAMSPVDAGAPRQRRKFTKATKYLAGTWDLSSAQVTSLMNHFENTCKLGQEPFDFVHPRTGVTVSVYFTARPVPTHIIGSRYMVALTYRIA